jgi:hypothetical protein
MFGATPGTMTTKNGVLLDMALVAFLLVGGCDTPKPPTVTTSGAEVSSLTRYGTYSYAPAEEAYAPEGYARGSPSPELLDRVRRDVDAELQQKGYRYAENGELVVRISTGTRTVDRRIARGVRTLETQGALVIDILDRNSGAEIFHGLARDAIRNDKVDDEQIARAVSKVLEDVPRSAR